MFSPLGRQAPFTTYALSDKNKRPCAGVFRPCFIRLTNKKTRLIPGKVPDVPTQEAFIEDILSVVEDARQSKNMVLLADSVHQIHNNENDYAWQFRGKEGTKMVPANTGRRRLNIIGALNPLQLKTTTLLMETPTMDKVSCLYSL